MATATTNKQEVKNAYNGAQKNLEKNIDDIYEKAEEKMSYIAQNLSDMTEKVKQASSDISDKSIDYVKKYPVHTALGAVAVGFVLGVYLTARRRS